MPGAKTALVTGAAVSVGRAVATRLAADGLTVVVSDRDEAAATETPTDLRSRGLSADSAAARRLVDPAKRSSCS